MADTQGKPRILFLCTGNSCRSQMAEGFARELKSDEVEADSAGTQPKGIHPLAKKVMAEAGVDLSDHRSKTIAELGEVEFDWVITLCGHAHENCPVFPGATRVVHVGFEDPDKAPGREEEVLQIFRKVRDQIREFVEGLPANLIC
jgi:arsenate reductase